jgi:hypothetical protein
MWEKEGRKEEMKSVKDRGRGRRKEGEDEGMGRRKRMG